MHYIVYKITNTLDEKFYIGKHQTKDLNDGYMGSGKLLKRAIKKYGVENFKKEILHVFDNEAEMNAKEKELVVISEDTYNLCPGGKGGFGYIHENKLYADVAYRTSKVRSAIIRKLESDEKFRKTITQNRNSGRKKGLKLLRERYKDGGWIWSGRKHSDETIRKMQKSKNVGKENSQYGTCWITNGSENKKIKKTASIPDGFFKGRCTVKAN